MKRLLEGAGLAALVAVAIVAIRAMAPPEPVPETAPADSFSAMRAARHLSWVARAPHPTGSDANDRVRAGLVQALGDLGLEVHQQQAKVVLRATGRISSARIVNVAGRLRGTAGAGGDGGGGGQAILLACHYDSVPQSFGAADDGSGVIALLETARAMKSRPPPLRDVIFLFTDGEEQGLLGAQAFVTEHPWRGDVGVVFNFEARGTSGTSTMFETSPGAAALLSTLGGAVPRPSASSAVTALARALPNGTDFEVFAGAGLPGLGFAFAEGLASYHTAWDGAANLDLASVQDQGEAALGLALALANRPGALGFSPGREAVYFDLFRAVLVRYPVAWAIALGIAALAAFGWLVARRVRRRDLGWSSLAAGAALPLGAVVLAGGLTLGASALAAVGLPGELALRQGTFRGAQALAMALAALLGGTGLLRRRFAPSDLASGALATWALLLVALLALAPAASFPLQWPLLFVSLAMLSGRRWALFLAWAASLVLLAPLGHAVHVAAGVGAPPVTAAFVALAGALFLPLVADWSRRRLLVTSLALLAAALLLVPAARLAVGRGERSDYLVHATDADRGETWWLASARPQPGALSGRLVAPGQDGGLVGVGDIDPGFRRRRRAPAPRIELPEPTVSAVVVPPGPAMAPHRHRLSVRSRARCIHLWQERGAPLTAVSVQGRRVPDYARFSPSLDARLYRLLTGDRSPALWKVKHCALGERELVVVVDAAGAAPVPVRIVEEHEGLPPAALPASVSRGAGLVPAQDSDVTLVARRVTLSG